jgi:ribosome-binding factor A
MLAGRRAVMIGDQLLRAMADLLMRKVNDPRIKGATLTGIHLSDNLRNARVYYSVLGDEGDIIRTQAGLDSAKGFIKREVALRVDLKYMPEIFFMHDPSLEKGNSLDKLFQRIRLDESTDAGE